MQQLTRPKGELRRPATTRQRKHLCPRSDMSVVTVPAGTYMHVPRRSATAIGRLMTVHVPWGLDSVAQG